MLKCENCGGELRLINNSKAVCIKCGTKHMKILSNEWDMVEDDKPFF